MNVTITYVTELGSGEGFDILTAKFKHLSEPGKSICNTLQMCLHFLLRQRHDSKEKNYQLMFLRGQHLLVLYVFPCEKT